MNHCSTLSQEIPPAAKPIKGDENGASDEGRCLSACKPRVSVVVPCHNEQDNVAHLVERLHLALGRCASHYELIFVDDASTDMTTDFLHEMARTDTLLRCVYHTGKFGQSAALLTGIQHARYEIVVTMDADLQNDPADIPAMLEMLKNVDAVCGVRRNRRDTWIKRASSRVANRVRHWILQDGIIDAGCCFRAIRSDALLQVPAFQALHRFLPTILKIQGYHVVQVPISHHPRMHGYSKYGVGNRLFIGIYDLIGMRWYKSRHISPNRLKQVAQTPSKLAGSLP